MPIYSNILQKNNSLETMRFFPEYFLKKDKFHISNLRVKDVGYNFQFFKKKISKLDIEFESRYGFFKYPIYSDDMIQQFLEDGNNFHQSIDNSILRLENKIFEGVFDSDKSLNGIFLREKSIQFRRDRYKPEDLLDFGVSDELEKLGLLNLKED